MPRRILGAVRRFADLHPEYATAAGAQNQCRAASALFVQFLLDEEITANDEAYIDEVDVIDGVAHKAVIWDGWIIDWTMRQYDSNAAFPVRARE